MKANQAIIIKKITKVEKAVANLSAAGTGNDSILTAVETLRPDKQVLLEDYELPLQSVLRMPDLESKLMHKTKFAGLVRAHICNIHGHACTSQARIEYTFLLRSCTQYLS